ncbi:MULTISPECIES: ECF transporter S component [Mumia]|uniref:ECF transporter S component n=1 Tax=Mumia TaxID=1546255 RepID=UPI001420F106|nr:MULTISPECIES: ECF transporter S component [unclassified Mumia]QMW66092.1 ECF transporter S component [Mumia sp. ZJ1417]
MAEAIRSRASATTRYRTVDLVTVAMLGVALGVVFWGWNQLFAVVSGTALFAFPPSSGLICGVWLLGGVVGGLVVRKPGAAVGTELVAATMSALLGNQWGMSVVVSGLIQGFGAELVFAVLLYRRWGVVAAALAGALAGAGEAVYEWFAYYADWSFGYQLTYLAFLVVSGALVAGVGGWALVRALASTGSLDAFGPGREHHERAAATSPAQA